jgi:hypothetical protein
MPDMDTLVEQPACAVENQSAFDYDAATDAVRRQAHLPTPPQEFALTII